MTTDAIQLLRYHWNEVPAADEETMQRAYAYATRGARGGWQQSLRRSRVPQLRVRLVLPVAAAICAAAACAVVFSGALGGSSVGNQANANQSVAGSGAGGGALTPDLGVPLSRALSLAAKAFGAPLIFPNALKVSDAEPMASVQREPSAYPGGPAPLSQVSVRFASPPLGITYEPTALTYWGSTYPNALDQYKAEIAQSDLPGKQIVHLSDGTPALIYPTKTGRGIEFRLGKLSITIWAPNTNGTPTTVDATTLQALAQSMLDQASSASH
jgi:hypothetical protein